MTLVAFVTGRRARSRSSKGVAGAHLVGKSTPAGCTLGRSEHPKYPSRKQYRDTGAFVRARAWLASDRMAAARDLLKKTL